jgi:beta-carotene 3-hydroxylase
MTMSVPLGLVLFAVTVLAMEGVAYALHRWVMHSRLGWTLHQSHHRDRHGLFEANDLYAVIFAAPSIVLIYAGMQGMLGPWANWVGAGIAAYGAIYFGFHDVIVHRRIAHRLVPRSPWFKRIVQAHRLHHAVESRDGGISFGFLWAPPVERLKAALADRQHAGVRAPKGPRQGAADESTSRSGPFP